MKVNFLKNSLRILQNKSVQSIDNFILLRKSNELSQDIFVMERKSSKADRKAFLNLFYDEFFGKKRDNIKGFTNFDKKLDKFLFMLTEKHRNLRIIKDAQGDIIGGFGYKKIFFTNELVIGDLVLNSKFKNYRNIKELFLKMAEEIKLIAEKNKVDKILCSVRNEDKSLIKLYARAGFKKSAPSYFDCEGYFPMECNVKDFAKNYLK